MLAQREVAPDRIRPLRRVEYDQLVESGLLDDSRVELLLGALVDTSPQGPLHADVVRALAERLIRELPSELQTRIQSPLAVSDDSEPEPDIAVVPAADYTTAHPTTALLVIEVADSSLHKDRGVKTALYASAEILEFWLVNLTERVFEVHRAPVAGRYTDVQRVDASGTVASGAFPTPRIRVGDILRN
jgi:Uma2 family endonuclease